MSAIKGKIMEKTAMVIEHVNNKEKRSEHK